MRSAQSFALNEAAMCLRALGRLAEAVEPMKAGLEMDTEGGDWKNAATAATNVRELSLTLGRVSDAVEFAEKAVAYADDSRGGFQREVARAALANALHQSGQLKKAEELFNEAEEMHKRDQPVYPLLYSLRGFQFCDLLLASGEFSDVRDRATRTLEWVTQQRWLLDIALDIGDDIQPTLASFGRPQTTSPAIKRPFRSLSDKRVGVGG